jgi:Pectinesterase
MNRRLIVRIATALLAVAMLAVPASALAGKGGKNKSKNFVVCEHGCKYKKIQKAVNKAKGKKNAVIKVKPGKYVEGVQVFGKKYKGLTIKGTGKTPKKTILEGKNAQLPGGTGIANNGIDIQDASNVTVENMWVRNFATNGVFWHDSNAENSKNTCKNPVGKKMAVSFNRSYGLFTFGCVGGSFVKSEGWGHGDSAYYVGGTPFQNNPKKTVLNKLESYENVLGYSGTNSKYVVIKNGNYYNNGVGLVPNTLDSEPYEPTGDSVIKNNNIFWNNFNYFLDASPVQTVSNGLGSLGPLTLQYPTGLGIALFGANGWKIQNNQIFGNFKWGVAMFSDPFNEGLDAMSQNNQVLNNQMGRNGTDTNAIDFWVDGSGLANCFSGNNSSTKAPDPGGEVPTADLYPECPAPAGPTPGASGTSDGDGDLVGQLVNYVGSTDANPPENQECSWTQHAHPAFKDYEPLDITPGPVCP